ncbi:3'-5' exonuclease [Endozoicomonas lisbonensis]|uniref:3'-5' exonuclease n=1 Tax=Endozoicomonas lisbonensis TaxID=3120522 RepID=UPI0033957438
MYDLILDTETTGLGAADVIVEIAIIRADTGETLMNSLVQPTMPITQGAMDIHGITEEMVANAPSWKDLHQQFIDITSQCDTMYIYNAPFDVEKIMQTAAQCGLQLKYDNFGKNRHCVMREFAAVEERYYPDYSDGRWSKLTRAAFVAGFKDDGDAHRALFDCQMTRSVMQWIKETIPKIEERRKRSERAWKYRESVKARKMMLVPDGTHINRDKSSYRVFDAQGKEYTYFKGGAPKYDPSLVTMSKLKISDMDRAEFVGMCTSTYGDEGYVFKIAQQTAVE